MVNGYCGVYHDRSYIDIHFWRVLTEMGNLCRRCIDCCLYFGLGGCTSYGTRTRIKRRSNNGCISNVRFGYHYRQCCRYLLLETGQKREKDSQGTIISCAYTLQKRTGFIACPFCLRKFCLHKVHLTVKTAGFQRNTESTLLPHHLKLIHNPVGIKPLCGFFPAPAPRAILHKHRRMCQAAPDFSASGQAVPERAPVLLAPIRKTPDIRSGAFCFLM